MTYFDLKTQWGVTPMLQIIFIAILFIASALYQSYYAKKTGKMYPVYPVSGFLLFVPLYEEIIFRGFVLFGFLQIYSLTLAIVFSSFLFGLWHLKNIFWESTTGLIKQMLYAGFVVGPILAIVTILTGTIWPAVVLHYLNNLSSPASHWLLNQLKRNRTLRSTE